MNFVVLLILLKLCNTVVTGGILSCKTGELSTSRYHVNYVVHAESASQFCDGGQIIDSVLWPGSPSNFNISVFDGDIFQLRWNPPEDGSANLLTGFLMEIYEESSLAVLRLEPYCFHIELILPEDPFPVQKRHLFQDAVFTLSCRVAVSYLTTLRVFISSLPRPVVQYDFDGPSVSATFNEIISSTSRSTSPGVVSFAVHEPLTGDEEDASPGNVVSMAALIVGATVSVGVLAGVIVFFKFKRPTVPSVSRRDVPSTQAGTNNTTSDGPGSPCLRTARGSGYLDPGLQAVQQDLKLINSLSDLSIK